MFSGNNNNNDNFSNQNLYQQNQISNPLIVNQAPQQPYYVGQPINNQNNVYNDMQYPVQQGQYYSPNMQQQQNGYQQPPIQNHIHVVNLDPNMINMQFISPEITYCNATITNRRKYTNSVDINGMIFVLRQIWAELNISFPQLNIIGQMNLLSTNSMQSQVIDPIIQYNAEIPPQNILAGKVVFCIRTLQKSIRKAGIIQLVIATLSTILASVGYTIYFNNSTNSSAAIVPIIFQIFLWALILLLQFFGVIKCIPKLMQVNIFISLINLFYGVALLSIVGIANSNSDFEDNGISIRLGVQIPLTFLGFISFIAIGTTLNYLKRLLILIKKAEESAFSQACWMK